MKMLVDNWNKTKENLKYANKAIAEWLIERQHIFDAVITLKLKRFGRSVRIK